MKFESKHRCFHTRNAGLGFSRPKPVFPVQNGINWDKPVLPSFSRPKLGKTVQKLGKIMLHYFSSLKRSPKCDVSNKSLTGQTRGSYNPVVMMYELIIQILWTEIFFVILIIQLVLTFTHNIIILLPRHVQNCDLICAKLDCKQLITRSQIQSFVTMCSGHSLFCLAQG